jgi:hypothetical protein
MSVPVDLAALGAEVERAGDVAFLVTSAPDVRPHVVSVRLRFDDELLVMPAGRTSRRNAHASPDVTVLWPGGPDYCLLVDGTAVVDDGMETVTVRPTGAILHRLAGTAADLPYCVPLEPVRDGES